MSLVTAEPKLLDLVPSLVLVLLLVVWLWPLKASWMADATAASTVCAAQLSSLSPWSSFLSRLGVSSSWSNNCSWDLYCRQQIQTDIDREVHTHEDLI